MKQDIGNLQDRRTFIKRALRHVVLAVFGAVATMFGLRRLTSDSALRTNRLPCDRCTKYPDCSYGQINFEKKEQWVARIDDCP